MNFRPDVKYRLGIDYETLSALNPRIVYCSTSGYGQDGPHSQWAGHDLNYLAITGALGAMGREGEPPVPPLNLVGDVVALLALAPAVDDDVEAVARQREPRRAGKRL